MWQTVSRFLRRFWSRRKHHYTQIQLSEPEIPGYEHINDESSSRLKQKKHMITPGKLPLRRIWTSGVLINLLSRFLMSLTVGTFQTLWFTFLSAPRYDAAKDKPALPSEQSFFRFSGGLGLPPTQVGMAMAILGFFGITLQLTSYPAISARLGTTGAFRLLLPLFPVICVVIPFLALLPSDSPAPKPMDGLILWISLCLILALYVIARTFVLPASAILINNCSPHPSRLGSIHGVAQSIGASARFIGPVVGGAVFGAGDAMGVVGLAWWLLAGVGSVSWAVGMFVREGSGHEILMPGEKRTSEGEVVYMNEQESSEVNGRSEATSTTRQ